MNKTNASAAQESASLGKLGFIGIGAIAEATIIGLIEHAGFAGPLLISERSKLRSDKLANRFPTIQVESENQAIVDQCDTVFVSVLPVQVREVLMRVNFRREQTLISMVAGLLLEEISQIVSPARKIHRLIPMPPIEYGQGPIPLCPPDANISNLFEGCGKVIESDDEEKFLAFSVSSGLMAMHHGITATVAEWMTEFGLDAQASADYASSLFQALATIETNTTSDQLAALPDESITVGGLNEQVLSELREENWFEVLKTRMDHLRDRLSE